MTSLESLLPIQDIFQSSAIISIFSSYETEPCFFFAYLINAFMAARPTPSSNVLFLSLANHSSTFYIPLLQKLIPNLLPYITFIDLDSFNPTTLLQAAQASSFLVIDDLNVLFYAFSTCQFSSSMQIQAFIRKIINSVVEKDDDDEDEKGVPGINKPSVLVNLTSTSLLDASHAANTVLHSSTHLLQLSPLFFRRSKTVDGVLTLRQGPVYRDSRSAALSYATQEIHYKLSESLTDSKFWFKGSIPSHTY